jgi:hypothetical protein
MESTVKKNWKPEWKVSLKYYSERLEEITQKELANIKAKWEASQKENADSGFCICGGVLKRDNILFCPKCKNENISYMMTSIS